MSRWSGAASRTEARRRPGQPDWRGTPILAQHVLDRALAPGRRRARCFRTPWHRPDRRDVRPQRSAATPTAREPPRRGSPTGARRGQLGRADRGPSCSAPRWTGVTCPAPAPRPHALLDLLLLYAMRTWFEKLAAPSGWAQAVRDPAVAIALRNIQHQPGGPVDGRDHSLARESNLSRAAFARRFTSLTEPGAPRLLDLVADDDRRSPVADNRRVARRDRGPGRLQQRVRVQQSVQARNGPRAVSIPGHESLIAGRCRPPVSELTALLA